MNPTECISAALRIGRRIAEQAQWQEGLCTWEIKTLDRGARLTSVANVAGPELYQGSSGIAFFLGELLHRTQERDLEASALGGILHALKGARELPPASFGFHSGRIGVAWAAARLAPRLGRPDLLTSAFELLGPSKGLEEQEQGIDVIGGAAGAIPALLELGSLLGRPEPLEMARALGDRLIHLAQQEPQGWSWNTLPGTSVRHLLGLAHGTAGMALALLELARATGEGRFRFAAEMAFLYENRFFDSAVSNWPDLRDTRLGEEVRSGRQEALRTAARAGWVPRYEKHFMTAWCHGSPGIGLSRLRAYELTGQGRYLEDLRAALVSTLPSVQGEELRGGNFSLCHGVAGNCELLLEASVALGDDTLREVCLEAAEYGFEKFGKDGGPWPCGTLTTESDPSLLLGEAGIGLFLLRLGSAGIPSPLLLRPDGASAQDRSAGEISAEELPGYQASFARAGDFFFGSTAALWRRLGAEPGPWIPEKPSGPLTESPGELRFRSLRRRLETNGGASELLEDALRLDRARWELLRREADFTHEFVAALARYPWEEIEPRRPRFVLSPEAALVETRWDWQAFKEEDIHPPEDESYFLLLRRQGQGMMRRVGPFAFLLLDSVREPRSLAEILQAVAEALGASAPEVSALEAQVIPQLQQLYRIGALDLESLEDAGKSAGHEAEPA